MKVIHISIQSSIHFSYSISHLPLYLIFLSIQQQGDIEEEKLNGELLKIRHDHHRAEALMNGEAEADHIRAFVKGLEAANVPFDTQVNMWQAV